MSSSSARADLSQLDKLNAILQTKKNQMKEIRKDIKHVELEKKKCLERIQQYLTLKGWSGVKFNNKVIRFVPKRKYYRKKQDKIAKTADVLKKYGLDATDARDLAQHISENLTCKDLEDEVMISDLK
jgi:hypothetical protein